MMQPLPRMNDDELARAPAIEDACFGSVSTARGHLPLEAMDVRARVVGLIAHIEVRQTFVNTLDEAMEATYIFPLPSRAAVGRFRMRVGERTVEGVIKERGQARVEYEEAITAGHRAAITEEERPGVFTMRVGNLMPRDRAEVTLELTGPLPLEEGDVTFRFPLVVAPRYIPGTPLSGGSVGDGIADDTDLVPDASRITPPVLLPGYPNPVRLRLRLEIDSGGLPVANLRSSLHAATESGSGGVRRIEVQPGERLDRDFIARWHVGDDATRTSLVMTPDAEGGEGTFALTLVPPAATEPARPRDVAFVLDRSGSMGGWKMVAARRAVARMVDTLTDADRFTVLAFDDLIERPERMGPALVAGTDRNRFGAVEFLAGLDARGGTEMARPLEEAASAIAGGYDDRDRILVLVTDGQVGNEDHILRNLSPRIRNARVFTLGIDRAVNEGFLRRLAAMGGGMCELVESEDRLDEVMDKVHRRIATPVITELSLQPAGLEIVPDTVVPARIPDLFEGTPVTITGRYRGAPAASDEPYRGTVAAHLRVRGTTPLGSPWDEAITGRPGDNPGVAKIWARGRVRELEDRYVTGKGDRSGLEKQIVDVSLRHSVLCRFTAFLAVDDSQVVNPGGGQRQITQPVESPDGWAMMMPGAPPPMGGRAPIRYGALPPMSPQAIMDGTPMIGAAPMAGVPMSPADPAPGASGFGGIVEKAKSLFVGRGRSKAAKHEAPAQLEVDERAVPAGQGIDLGRYLDRLRALVEAAQRASSARLGVERLAAGLVTLIDDLRSIGADRDLIDELDAARTLAAEAAEKKSGEAEALARAIEKLDRVLADGGRATEGKPTSRRGEFWK